MKRFIVWFIGLVLVAIVAYGIYLGVPRHDYFIERVGTLASAEVLEEQRPVDLGYSVRLKSSTGLEVDMRVLRPKVDIGEKVPLVLILGGQQTGKDAVELLGDADGIAFAAIDYPYRGDKDLDGFWKSIYAIPDVQRAFLDSPPAVSLALTWLLQQDWIDAERVELAGVSLGVPFAMVAGAVDERFSRVWMLHGGGDNVSWVAHNARRHIDSELLRNITSRVALFLVHGSSFEPQRWMPEIAPRPLVIVAARDDDYVPREAQKPLEEAARSPYIELIWTDGRHIGPNRGNELQQLVAIVRNRVLGSGPRTGPVHPLQPLDWEPPDSGSLVELPDLTDIDAYLRLETVDLFGAQLGALLADEALIDKIVATVDNLPRGHVAERVRPLGRLQSDFVTKPGTDDAIVIDPLNFERYRVLVDLFVLADPDAVTDLYRRYYPLFQKSYEALGYPNGYFNDRVVEVIDHLLATPVPDTAPRLARPHVLYEYADPELESLSGGQKLLLRMGADNATRTKQALEQLRARIAVAD